MELFNKHTESVSRMEPLSEGEDVCVNYFASRLRLKKTSPAEAQTLSYSLRGCFSCSGVSPGCGSRFSSYNGLVSSLNT